MKSYYFGHDDNARNDEKICNLIFKKGWKGYGLYWAIVEDLYKNGGKMRRQYNRIAYTLRSEEKEIKEIVEDFELFIIEKDIFYNKRVLQELQQRNKRIKAAKKAANTRWDADSNAIAMRDAMRTQCGSNAGRNAKNKNKIKKKKEDKNKEKKIYKEKKFKIFWSTYDKKYDINRCKNYWFGITPLKNKKIIKIEQYDKIIEHVKKYVRNTYKNNKYPIRKHPATYLYNSCWEDEIIEIEKNKNNIEMDESYGI